MVRLDVLYTSNSGSSPDEKTIKNTYSKLFLNYNILSKVI